jgi:exosortase
MDYFFQVAAFPWRIFESTVKACWWKFGVLLLLLMWLYASILFHLTEQWWHDPNFSHGFFVPVFSLFVLWRERSRFACLRPQPTMWGLPILIIAICTLLAGILGAELFLSRVSLLLLMAGLLIFFRGWRYFGVTLFPWAFLVFMIPIPIIVFNHIAFPLQILASKIAAAVLPLFGVPVLREGNVINIPALSLEVAEACSGIRSLLSLMTLAIIYGYLRQTGAFIRMVLGLASIPIAVVANSFRIVGTGVLVQYWDANKGEGFFHSFSGWLIFTMSFAAIVSLHWLLHAVGFVREDSPGGR